MNKRWDKLLARNESNRIEYKRELTDSLEKEVVAFLNYKEGGVIFIGIDGTTHQITGIKDIDSIQLIIKDRIKNNILPSTLGLFDVLLEEEAEGKEYIKIVIASGSDKPYYIKKFGLSEKGCFIRIGSASEPMSSRMIEEMFSRRTRNSIGRMLSPKNDLSFEQLKIYYQEIGLTLNDRFDVNLELLTSDLKFNYAAYLLSDNNGISIKVAKYKGIDRIDLIENNEFGFCSLLKATKQVLTKLDIENKVLTKITSKERIEKRQIDSIALREAVINAMVHNDYSSEIPPKFELFKDRLEITSTGGLPSGLNQEEFFEGYSAPPNKELMRVFRDLRLVEFLGSGIPRIIERYDRSIFKFTDHYLRVVFDFSIDKSTENEESDRLGEKLGEKLGENRKKILQWMLSHPKVTIDELSIVIGISTTAIEKNIKYLKDRGYIKRNGGDKGGWWEVVN
jgi:ATP-dependent DNA helicase RecG